MGNEYSSYYLYKRYEVIGEELVDLGIASIDANGTMPVVMKNEYDPACDYREPIYRWVQTYDTLCVEEFEGKYLLTLNNGDTVGAECSLTADTVYKREISAYSTSLVSAVMGECVTTIGNDAFGSCKSLTSVTIPNSVTLIDANAFCYCSGLTNVVIPNSVIKLGRFAFGACNGFTSITIPDSVSAISINCFADCVNLVSVTIGSGVRSIKQMAFDYCTSLTSVTIKAVTPPTLGSNVFRNTNDCPIFVPAASVNTYKSATNWSAYASRIQAIPNT